ncbi:MAG: hypothetical protein OWQ51_11275 [Pyrobaculum arsenaticum]|uniref:Uncharacterized protein n=2 Tax=Pyrobaculum arsenaticum TaxID=121277 RepID=A4WHT9_PYRAR|nr:hypothetical protein [Pyrobaculum arsenaticum]ABP49956.1 conserved hypothetical protein [Pyrobaculum arsenaticum DSM 13514]MCY0891528.1 hypothetical protein [Pyrobaculum arsenaticum]NYR16628.1 hypothetical protein [Pyrobaculum arsenaticum]
MKYIIPLYIDQARQKRIRGTPLRAKLRPIFGGEIKVPEAEADEDLAHVVPAAFRKAPFEAVVGTGDAGCAILEKVLH